MAAGQFSLHWLWTSNQPKRSSHVIFKSRSHPPTFSFLLSASPIPRRDTLLSSSMQPLSRMVLISAAWVTWQPRFHHWRVEHSDWSALVMWGGSQGVGRASWLTAPHRMERSCFQREECRGATYIYLREWINNTITAHLTLQCSIL